jgi:hypothetical protein
MLKVKYVQRGMLTNKEEAKEIERMSEGLGPQNKGSNSPHS